ncbi:hypothetical protein Tsp_01319 [Trichinella spiralis]|uniref:hypothetical protein n=1 Tax=Trichinella spiralis TaxID=6334 RepID=UPI0001EFCE76|nr:hypothetical protein Tsp_01319 [Trichinella spiralis]
MQLFSAQFISRYNMKNEKLNNDEQQTRCGQKRCSNCLAFTERLQASLYKMIQWNSSFFIRQNGNMLSIVRQLTTLCKPLFLVQLITTPSVSRPPFPTSFLAISGPFTEIYFN